MELVMDFYFCHLLVQFQHSLWRFQFKWTMIHSYWRYICQIISCKFHKILSHCFQLLWSKKKWTSHTFEKNSLIWHIFQFKVFAMTPAHHFYHSCMILMHLQCLQWLQFAIAMACCHDDFFGNYGSKFNSFWIKYVMKWDFMNLSINN